MILDTTEITVENGIVHWQNNEFNISVEEAEAICRRIRTVIDKEDPRGILVDNENAAGTWPTEIDSVWDGLMEDIYAAGIDCATVCPSRTNAMHVNKLSKDNGTHDTIRAYTPDERHEAESFVGMMGANTGV